MLGRLDDFHIQKAGLEKWLKLILCATLFGKVLKETRMKISFFEFSIVFS